jgi:hypothetical protein
MKPIFFMAIAAAVGSASLSTSAKAHVHRRHTNPPEASQWMFVRYREPHRFIPKANVRFEDSPSYVGFEAWATRYDNR